VKLSRRILLLLAAALMALMMVAGPALAAPPAQASKGLAIAVLKSGGNAPPPICDVC
jgi:ABC-type sugar transport system substrate-binding protein